MRKTPVRRAPASLTLALAVTAVAVCTARHASAVETAMEIDITAVDFGEVTVGKTSTMAVTLTNGGAVSFGPINMFGGAPPSAEFNASQNCQGTTLAAGGSCKVTYSFAPTAPGTFNDASNFTVSQTPNQSDGEDFSVSLVGVGVNPIAAAPLSLDFGDVIDGDTSPSLSTTITNITDEPFGPLDFFGAPPALPFASSQDCQSVTLAPAGSCKVSYLFRPTAPGTFTATSNFTITGGSQGVDFTVSLTASGVVNPACDPDDCDDDACTVGDACVQGTCSPGSVLTVGRLSGLVLEATSAALAACGVDRGRSVKTVVKPLIRAARRLGQAAIVAQEVVGKKLTQARSAVDRASENLGNERGGLSRGCATRLDAAIATARTGLSCLP